MTTENPVEIRETFSRNLRQLAKPHSNISELCRQMNINRTQFNRYLNGDSFPRPDTLMKICSFFEVSPLIFVYPLEDTDKFGALPRRREGA